MCFKKCVVFFKIGKVLGFNANRFAMSDFSFPLRQVTFLFHHKCL